MRTNGRDTHTSGFVCGFVSGRCRACASELPVFVGFSFHQSFVSDLSIRLDTDLHGPSASVHKWTGTSQISQISLLLSVVAPGIQPVQAIFPLDAQISASKYAVSAQNALETGPCRDWD